MNRSLEQILNYHIDKTFKLLERCKGVILATGNHLPSNIPNEMLDSYIEAVLPRLPRG